MHYTAAQSFKKSNTTISPQKDLIDFYENGMTLLSKDFCQKAKSLAEQVLKDNRIHKAETPVIKEFKQNLTNFLHNYEFFEHYHLYNEMLKIFSEMTIGFYYPNKDNQENLNDYQYILQLLRTKGYDNISDDYEQKFQKFVKEKFLNKFEEFQKHFTQKDLNQHKNLLQWFKELKKCQNYPCYFKYFNLLINVINTPKEELLELINENLERITLFYILGLKDIAEHMKKDQIYLAQLSKDLKTEFIHNLNEFLQQLSINTKYERIHDLILMFHNKLAVKFYYNNNLAIKDQEMLKHLFDQYGFAKLQADNQKLFNNFVQNGLTKLFKQFKQSLSNEELKKEQNLLKWFEEIAKLHTYEERVKSFNKFYFLIITQEM